MLEEVNGFIVAQPIVALVLISALLTLVTTLLMRHFTDQEHIKLLKGRQKELQKELKECHKKGDSCRLEEINKEAVDISLKLMKASFSIKQMLITFLPLIFIFQWIRGIYTEIYGGWWILYYILISMVCSSFYRKMFKMA